jgi:hypothetical protein
MTVSQLGRRDFLKLSASGVLGLALSELGVGRALARGRNDLYHCVPIVELTSRDKINSTTELPGLREFVKQVADGSPEMVRGAWSLGKLAEPVVQQPYGNPGYVSTTDGVLTNFSVAQEVENVGLLAHNTTETGQRVAQLAVGDEVKIVAGDGVLEHFKVDEIRKYRAHDPTSPYSNFSPIPEDGSTLSAIEVFDQVYRGQRRVTFQTCIENEGDVSWGRLFVIANKEERTRPERSDLLD